MSEVKSTDAIDTGTVIQDAVEALTETTETADDEAQWKLEIIGYSAIEGDVIIKQGDNVCIATLQQIADWDAVKHEHFPDMFDAPPPPPEPTTEEKLLSQLNAVAGMLADLNARMGKIERGTAKAERAAKKPKSEAETTTKAEVVTEQAAPVRKSTGFLASVKGEA